MSTPENPGESRLTRKQLREIRLTGATPIVGATPEDGSAPEGASAPDVAEEAVEPEVTVETEPEKPAPPVHLARAAEPVAAAPAPIADADVDLGVSPLTRRQAREQERIRTASVPVITTEVAAAHAAAVAAVRPPIPESPALIDEVPRPIAPDAVDLVADLFEEDAAQPVAEAIVLDEPEAIVLDELATDAAAELDAEIELDADDRAENPDAAADSATQTDAVEAPEAGDVQPEAGDDDDEPVLPSEWGVESGARPVLRPEFGSELLVGAEPMSMPPSFDQLIARNASSTGSQSASNALILSEAPAASPIVGPVAATGEVLVTGTFALPEGLGSTGHAAGTADGKETDAVLVDRELPAHSSPTPIAASAAISTVKGAADIIRPPAPEKGGRLMLTLAITAGALALALVGVLILAIVTGVF